MALGQAVDSFAQRLLELQKVSPTQWALRLTGAVATLLALALTYGTLNLWASTVASLVTLIVLLAVAVQVWNPDSDLGLLAPGMMLLTLLVQGETPTLRAAGIGLALLLAHSIFALAATIPVHGEFDRSAWLLAGKGLLPVLVVSIVALLLVVALSGMVLGPWTLILGVLAAIVLFVTVLPRLR